MGGKTLKPGGATQLQPDLTTASGVPGKSTLVESQPKPTRVQDVGVDYITNENQAPAKDRFLTQHQRDLVTFAYQDNVNSAQSAYLIALNQVWTEQLLREEDGAPVLLTFLIDVIAAQALVGFGAAWKWFSRAPQQDVFSVLRGEDVTEPGSILTMIRGMNVDTVTLAMKSAVDRGKAEAKAGLGGLSKDKKQSIEYLNLLGDRSVKAFEHQRLDPIDKATDAELVILFHSYRTDMGHTLSGYKAAITDALERFKASQASKIGRERYFSGARDTKVAWVQRGPAPPRLHYLTHRAETGQSPHTMANPQIPMLGRQEDGFSIAHPVEREFVDTAIEKHREVWGAEPETRKIGTWQRTPDAPRDVKDLNQFVKANNEDYQPVDDFNQNDPRTWVPK